ncbi:MAG: glutamine--fructose-6-phosphate transaminase (isomerizing) [Bacilli bacterium]|nr:glutamine--fructose-6-phosphate transaminase (isomerizing) [Bacilli bacterium]
MCGIVGYVGNRDNAIKNIIDGLIRLEYRGYDSAGISYIFDDKIIIKKNTGRVKNLENNLDFNTKSNVAIGHTRWATHGIANTVNSHPHQSGKITIVHNGIIENFDEIKKELINNNIEFKSTTDTEVACALLNYLYGLYNDFNKAIIEFQNKVKGSYAIAAINEDYKDKLFVIKNASPLVLGVTDYGNFIGSDMPSILDKTNKFIILDDGEFGILTKDDIKIFDKFGNQIDKPIKKFSGSEQSMEKQGYDHFMLKEIHEQPEVTKRTMNEFINDDINSLIDKMPDLSKYKKIHIVACGSAMHAGLIGKNLIEEFANVEVNVEIASEYRYKRNFVNKDDLVIVISQSGETADTLAAVEITNKMGVDTLGIINVVDSSIARNTKYVLYTKAGIEVAVATTKAYSAQVALLSLIALNLANSKNKINNDELINILNSIKELPVKMENLLNDSYEEIAQKIYNKNDIFFIGRDIDYSISQEGSLKLKEISYLHSEAYPAGELKHGTISLIDNGTPVIAIVTKKDIASKTLSNIKEVKSRGAFVIVVTTSDIEIEKSYYDEIIKVPTTHPLFQSLLTVIPLQLVAYEVARKNNCDIDKPKNLAKSVTVE